MPRLLQLLLAASGQASSQLMLVLVLVLVLVRRPFVMTPLLTTAPAVSLPYLHEEARRGSSQARRGAVDRARLSRAPNAK